MTCYCICSLLVRPDIFTDMNVKSLQRNSEDLPSFKPGSFVGVRK